MSGWHGFARGGWMLAIGGLCLHAPAGAAPAPRATTEIRDIFNELADEVSDKMLASPAFQEKSAGGRKARIVIGDVRNNSDDEGIRVDDIFNEIRNRIVATGTARLFAQGELNVDFIIAPELTSQIRMDNHARRKCFTLQLTLTTIGGEYIAAHSAVRCR